jgi:DNA-binding transcriptional regulator YiaG
MTPTDFRSTLATLGWSMHHLARLIGRPVGTVKNWQLGRYAMPPDAAAWLARRLDDHHRAMRDDPPPRK